MKLMKDILLFLEISDILSLLLILITILTVRFANKTLLMEYSSQILISRYRLIFIKSQYTNDKNEYSWEVDLENKGRGYVVKGFILISIKSRDRRSAKQFFLSKPIVGIDPQEKDIIKLELSENELGKFDPKIDTMRLEVYYQDALNNLYVVTPEPENSYRHLEKFDILPKKIRRLTLSHFKYLYKFRRAIKQGNTHVNRVGSQSD